MEAHTVRFNGTDGSPKIHPDAAVQMDGAPTCALLKRVRVLLKSAMPQHALVKNGWCNLAEHVYSV